MKKLYVIGLVLLAPMATTSCDVIGDVNPVEAVCTLCQVVDESGICDMVQTTAAECKEGETLVLVGIDEVLKDIEAGKTVDLQSRIECRDMK